MKHNKAMSIFLSGFMGAGKTAVGKRLANMLAYSFVDLDDEIERKAGCSIKEMFEQKGESFFRKAEREAIGRALSVSSSIIALGGGALQNQSVIDQIKEKGLLVYIECPVDVILKRIAGDKKRPLLLNEEDNIKAREVLRDDLSTLYEERRPFYRQAEIIIDSSRYSTAKETAEKLHSKIEEYDKRH